MLIALDSPSLCEGFCPTSSFSSGCLHLPDSLAFWIYSKIKLKRVTEMRYTCMEGILSWLPWEAQNSCYLSVLSSNLYHSCICINLLFSSFVLCIFQLFIPEVTCSREKSSSNVWFNSSSFLFQSFSRF